MTEVTPLDLAHAAMERGQDTDRARLRFFAQLADEELFLMLDEEAEGDALHPTVFALEEGQFLMAFDREARLAAFADAPVPYAALPGRVVASLLVGQGIGLGLNLGVAPSAMLLPPDAVEWLAKTLGHAPTEVNARAEAFLPPAELPEALQEALIGKLARLSGLAGRASLAGVRYDDGRVGHVLAVVGADDGAQAAIAKAVGEALTFSGVDAGEIDVVFLTEGAPAVARVDAVGVPFSIPALPVEAASAYRPVAPGMDPDKPPKLR